MKINRRLFTTGLAAAAATAGAAAAGAFSVSSPVGRAVLGNPPDELTPPAGFVFLTDRDGAYLTDADGAYLIEAI